jgi:hypothetical protein
MKTAPYQTLQTVDAADLVKLAALEDKRDELREEIASLQARIFAIDVAVTAVWNHIAGGQNASAN